ncbi:MAG: hypothetical protein FJZ09_00540 [Candidatus Omnitrophica bacterium]|nr:hypothetical protein [Candidatus Omnitrophota bacterium]
MSRSKTPYVHVTEASAGSGKTFCLAKQYLGLILSPESHPQDIESILAITFTNKAARQMKERILEFLKKIALKDPSLEKDILDSLTIPKDEAPARARQVMDHIATNYNYFQVKTIDSFINMILLGCSYQIGLSAGFQIRDDRDDYLTLSLDACIEQALRDKAIRKAFDGFLRQYIYLEGKETWLPKKDILTILGAMLYHFNVYSGPFKKFALGKRDLYEEKQKLLGLYKKLLKQAPEGINGTFYNTLERFVGDNPEIFDFKDLTKANFLKDELPMNKNAKAPADLEKLWKEIRKTTTELSGEEARSYFNCYVDIFNLVYLALRTYSHKDDVMFLEELNQQANSLIRENGVTVPELYLSIAMRLRHYLIDEFQDTSVLQWMNLYQMVEEALSTGGTLFYVGDKKQAIFSFRGGEVELFDRIKQELKAQIRVDFLKRNYRSAKEIVEFNNAVFSPENLKRFLEEQQKAVNNELKYFNAEDMQEILRVFEGPRQEYKPELQGLVSLEPLIAPNGEERDELAKAKTIALIDELTRKSLRKADITILCRGNDEVELVSSWLIEKNIPVESEKTLNIKNNKFIRELVALLRFLNSPIDNLSFGAFILGDLFLEASGLEKEKMHDFLFGLRDKLTREKGFYIFREFRRNFPKTWKDLFEESYSEVGFIGLYELLVDILSRFQVFNKFPEHQGFFMHFLEIVRGAQEEHPGIFDFLEYFDSIDEKKLFVNSSGADAVRVMTIHKAKGLGFPVVIIPFLYLDINDLASQTSKGRVSYVVEQEPDGLALLRLDKKYAQLSEEMKERYRKEYKREFADELNAIYVALTRAENELYVFVPHGMRSVNNVARFLFPESPLILGKPAALKAALDKEGATRHIESARYWRWNEFLKEEFSDKRLLEKREALLGGKVLHQILASVANLDKQDKEEAIKLGLESARDLYPQIADFSPYAAKIRKVLEAKSFRQYFYLGDAQVFQEKEVVNSSGDTKRLDRLIITDKSAWIVDYKSREEEELDYAKQIREYREIIAQLYPKLEVKGYLLYLEELKVEEVDG